MDGFVEPNQVLNKLKLKPEMDAAEFGCGSGSFTIPLAQKLNEGQVYGFDVQQEPLSALKGEADLKNINNITTRRANLEQPESSNLPAKSVDVVLIVNMLFQVEDEEPVINEAARVLKKGGKCLVVDWKEEANLGPQGDRESAEFISNLAKEAGFEVEEQFDPGNYHWGLILKS
ncbi:MAG: class I SAM-dependent methyltransferase [Candidatus Paceibacterota bacterium]